MKIVVDTNIIFSYFPKQSGTRELISNLNFELFSCELALEELNRNYDLIKYRYGTSPREFNGKKREMALKIKFFAKDKYQKQINLARKICPDKKDVEFFALALKLNCPLWSNEKKLKNQNKVEVLSTEDLIHASEFLDL